MADAAVSVSGIGKRFRIAHQREPYGRLTESLAGAARGAVSRLRGHPGATTEWFWALRDVTFDVPHGNVVGIVGRNGAGKSTLLKILSRIMEPTTGEADLRGRVASLLEVGTGFHPELTGRENVYLSGAILGMPRRDTQRRFDEIVAFADVEQFLDTPVKRYSSGMLVRLGFAVAAHLEPEILIVDEVLAVGDTAFQRKCLAKMEDVSHEGRTILFVSHNMPAVESLCSSGILLDHGAIAHAGTASDVVQRYLETVAERGQVAIASRTDRQGDGRLRFTDIEADLRTGADSEIRLRYEGRPGLRNVDVAIGLFTTRGEGAAHLSTDATAGTFATLPASGWLGCRLPALPLLPGNYTVNVFGTVNGTIADWVTDAAVVEVIEGDLYGTGRLPAAKYGSVALRHGWALSDG
jgi:lipopolysaccharide transport system ATP-binding protein